MTDILEQLRSRTQRPTVPDRSDPLLNNVDSDLNDIKTQSVGQNQSTEQVKNDESLYGSDLRRFTLRIDAPIGIDIEAVCNSQKITPETLLEAFFHVYGFDKISMEKVIDEAKLRYQKRKLIGVKRRIKSMNEKFN
jgi:hypothetical protein